MYYLQMVQKSPEAGTHLPATTSHSEAMEQVRNTIPVHLFDDSEPRSLINLLPENIKKHVKNAVFERPELFEMDELTLYKLIKTSEVMMLTPTDNRIRTKFWFEYDHCQSTFATVIDWKRVIAGVCSYEVFFRNFLVRPYKVAWLLCPPTGYVVKTNEALEFGIEQLREILDYPVMQAGGKVDSKLGELKLKIVALLDTRVKGAPIQRNIVANLTGKAAANAVQGAVTGHSIEDMQARLKDLERRERELLNGGQPVTIEIKKEG